jgi:hypothetical protein
MAHGFDTDRLPSDGCFHWPWWRLAALRHRSFDVIAFGANLCEMTEDAFGGYCALIRECLRPAGTVIVQCFGAEHSCSQATAREALVEATGLAEQFFVPDGTIGFATAVGIYSRRPTLCYPQ